MQLARFHYGSHVHLPIVSFFDSANSTQEQYLDILDRVVFEEGNVVRYYINFACMFICSINICFCSLYLFVVYGLIYITSSLCSNW